jgi:hypothetical protein
MSARRIFWLAIGAGLVLRIAHALTSLGTTDMSMWYRFSEMIERDGIFHTYDNTSLLNHPPFALLFVQAIYRFAAATGLEFAHLFRIVTSVADVVTTIALARIAGRDEANGAPLLFFLSPAAIFISGFHGNTDPLMIMFLVLAVWAVTRDRPIAGGLLLAAAVGIKILPLFVAPLLLIACRGSRARQRFLAAMAVACALIFMPGMIVVGPAFIDSIFFYTGLVRKAWGIPLLRFLIDGGEGVPGLTLVLIAAAAAIWTWVWRGEARRATAMSAGRLLALIGLVYLVLIFFAPGYGVQYLYWPLPFVAFALPRAFAAIVHGAVSVYLFATYTVWSEGWPWWFAGEQSSPEANAILGKAGIPLWVLFGIAATVALVRLRRERV